MDPRERAVEWLVLRDGEYERVERSQIVELGARELAEQLAWPGR